MARNTLSIHLFPPSPGEILKQVEVTPSNFTTVGITITKLGKVTVAVLHDANQDGERSPGEAEISTVGVTLKG